MIDDGGQRVQPDAALTDLFVPVLVAGEGVFAVVQVNGPQAGQPQRPVERVQHTVQIVHDVVSAVVHVAGVQTDTQQLGMLHAVNDGAQLLKAAAYLAALSGHGFQKDRGRLAGAENIVERLSDQLDAHLRALLDVAAGVEVIEAAGEVLQPREVVRHGVFGKLPQLGVRGAGVQRVGRVGQNGEEAVLRGERAVGRGVRLVDGLGRAAPGIAGEKLKGVGADLRRRFSHGQKSLGRGEMTSDLEHEGSFPMCWFSPTGPGRPAA